MAVGQRVLARAHLVLMPLESEVCTGWHFEGVVEPPLVPPTLHVRFVEGISVTGLLLCGDDELDNPPSWFRLGLTGCQSKWSRGGQM